MAEPVIAADGRPLKASLNRALRRSKLRALLLIAPLLIFILLSFVMPIVDMLFRSVENQIVSETLPRTTVALGEWDKEGAPEAPVFEALARDLAVAVERKAHTRLGSRLNYELSGASSLLRKTGRNVDEIGETVQDALGIFDPIWKERDTFGTVFGAPDWVNAMTDWTGIKDDGPAPAFVAKPEMAALFPDAIGLYSEYSQLLSDKDENPFSKKDWPIVAHVFAQEVALTTDLSALTGDEQALIAGARGALDGVTLDDPKAMFIDADEDWGGPEVWTTISTYAPAYTDGYFLNSIDMLKGADGVEARPDNENLRQIVHPDDDHVFDHYGKLYFAGLSNRLAACEP